jgi:tetratricopeptide (TPR) repeat protein
MAITGDFAKARLDRSAVPTSGAVELSLSVRVPPNSYLAGLLLGTFFSALCFYLRFDIAGFILFIFSWVLLPYCALNDLVAFDGRRLTRTGLLPRIWTRLSGARARLKVSDIEQVDTQAIRALRRAGNVYYRYRTNLRGKGMLITITSGGEDFRRMIAEVLTRLSDDVLDSRSIDLRDHLSDPKETLMKAEFEHIPSADVLRQTNSWRVRGSRTVRPPAENDETRSNYLRSLGNELRVHGFLLQAIEAFRRALVIRPNDPRLLFECARCIQSLAAADRDPRLERKAIATMRLAERRANDDPALLERIGEAYFQAGKLRRADHVFRRVLGREGLGFRAARGLAEIALREGKIAHVVHHFGTAHQLAKSASPRRWTNSEVEYFSRLNDDPNYLEMEVSRVNMLDSIARTRRVSLRIALLGLPAILIGVIGDDSLIADIGWAVTTVCLLLWTGLFAASRMFSPRIPYELLNEED